MHVEVFKRWLRKHAMNLENEVGEINQTVENLDESQKVKWKDMLIGINFAKDRIDEAIEILQKIGSPGE